VLNPYERLKPISVRIGYEWPKEDKTTGKSPKDKLWHFLRDEFRQVLDSIQVASKKRSGEKVFFYKLGRMRARHGTEMLSRFMELCKISDILAFDISSQNPNVMFELGLAIAAKGIASGRIFLFAEKLAGHNLIPSNLSGYFITYYKNDKGTHKIIDKRGFAAAFRGIVLEDARARGMWGSKTNEVEGLSEKK